MHTATLEVSADSTDDKKLIEELLRSRTYRDYEDTFTDVTGLPLVFRPVEFFGLPFQGTRKESELFASLSGNKQWCALYLRRRNDHSDHTADQPRSIQCPFGLTETMVPVRLGNRVIGFLLTGQVFTRQPELAKFKKSCHELFPIRSRAEKRAFKLWKKTQFIPTAKYEAIVQLLNFFAQQLSAVSSQIAMQRQRAEPSVVLKAREFIAQNRTEMISLGAVAKAAGASVFHFCKIFRKATGLTFTDYVARLRLEDARTRLANPNLRVSQIAYDVGFQSLTQFNRVFKRVIGESPTKYRTHLLLSPA
ncbi:MAG TPA: helix-turn-helix domain-containing protein [Chthoniobacterales bacterium]|nr:helix-turn-helix domain-containing protein [Chthoniobacterales bacterium]